MRAKFYSNSDYSIGFNLERAEEVLSAYDAAIDYSLEDAIEFFNVILLFDSNVHLNKWSDIDYDSLKNKSSLLNSKIVEIFKNCLDKSLATTQDDSIFSLYSALDLDYKEDFWKIIEKYVLFHLIDQNIVVDILNNDSGSLNYILSCRKLTKMLDNCLAVFMLNNPAISAPLLIETFFVVEDSPVPRQCFIPVSLSIDDREKILEEYISLPDTSPGILRIIASFKDDPAKLKASPKLRLAARKRADERESEIISGSTVHTLTTKFEIGIEECDSELPVLTSFEGTDISMKLNTRILDNLDEFSLMMVFYHLWFLDDNDFISLTFNPRTSGIFEQILTVHQKGAYPVNDYFKLDNDAAVLKIISFDRYLNRRGLSIEKLIENFYNREFSRIYGYTGLALKLPESGYALYTKNKDTVPEIESILRQYDLFAEEGTIDPELFANNYAIQIADARSIVPHKYAVMADNAKELQLSLYLLFSNQSRLYLGKKWKSRSERGMPFGNRLMETCNISEDELEDFHKADINFLVTQGILKLTEGKIEFVDSDLFVILEKLYHRPELSYWHLNPTQRKLVDDMVTKGWLVIDEHLFSPSERDYLDFHLNDRKFSNGLSLRNRYAHGVGVTKSEEEQRKDYYTILKILVVVLLKINADLAINRFLTNSNG